MVYDQVAITFIPFTKRQALQNLYGKKGNTSHLAKTLRKITVAKERHDGGGIIVDKVTNLAMQWHRNAMDSVSPEVRFMNHWVALEQLFKNLDNSGRAKSTADVLVASVSRALFSDQHERLLANLWGDLLRCDFMGKKPLVAHHSGKLKFTNELTSRLNPNTQIIDKSPIKFRSKKLIDLRIISPSEKTLKNYRIDYGFRIFVKPNQEIKKGEWLAGLPLTKNHQEDSAIYKKLFEGIEPPVKNLVYLWRYHAEFIREWFHFVKGDIINNYVNGARKIDADLIDGFGKIETLITSFPELGFPNKTELSFDEKMNYIISEWTERDSALTAWSNIDMKIPNIISLYEISKKLKDLFPTYKMIADSRKDFTRERSLPVMLIKELFRDCEIPVDRLWFIYNENEEESVNLLISSCPDEPLLKSRIQQIKYDKRVYKIEKYIWDLDRMRRTRNSLVHTASIDKHINLLSRRLYQYSKIFLSKVLNRLAFKDYKDDYYLLSWWTR
jgi:hypothetical protein